MYALIENGAIKRYPYSINDLKLAYPMTSFPATVSDASLESFGVYRVYTSTPPAHDSNTQTLEEEMPVFSVEGNRWAQVWRVRNLNDAELKSRYDAQAESVRVERNSKLSECDWTQVLDAPVDQTAWAAYRQDLRDLTEQVGFPWDVKWPEPPK